MRLPFRRTVVFERLHFGESNARLMLYPRRGLVSVLAAGGVGYQKSDARAVPSPRASDPKENKLQ